MSELDPATQQPAVVKKSKFWTSTRQIEIPELDIVSYVFHHPPNLDLDRPIFVDVRNDAKSITAATARRMVRQLVRGFQVHGLCKGDRVCIHAPNNVFYPLLWLAVIGAGGCVAGNNPSLTSDELVHHFHITSPRFIVAHADFLESLLQATEQCRISRDCIFVLGIHQAAPNGCLAWEALLKCGESEWLRFGEQPGISKESIAVLAATSGTTGLPKCAEVSHAALVAQCEMITVYNHPDRGKACASQLICLPVFHAFAGPLGLLLPLRLGLTTYFLPRFQAEEYVGAIHEYSITNTAVVPAIVSVLLACSESTTRLLRSLRYMICAGAPMSATTQRRLSELLHPEANIVQCWGLTETSWVTSFNPSEKNGHGSVGRLLPNVDLKIVDDAGNRLRHDDAIGEAWVRSPGSFSGYRKSAPATTWSDSEGFYQTGDLIRYSQGKVFILDRLKDTFKVKGWQVSPSEVEGVLMQYPNVVDAVVVPVRIITEAGLEELSPRAYVTYHASPEPSDNGSPAGKSVLIPDSVSEDIKAFVASRVVTYKRLTGGVVFVPHIPRSPTGKLLRRQLELLKVTTSGLSQVA